jgi:hypothetical protein
VQVIQYAARAIQLARLALGRDFETGFLQRLECASSNIAEHGNGRAIYEKFVRPAMIDWDQVVAHYAVSSLFQMYGEKAKIFLYDFVTEERSFAEMGKAKLAVGRTRVEYELTHQFTSRAYAVLYMGEHNLTGAVKEFGSIEEFQEAARRIRDAFDRGDFPETIRLIDRHFGPSSYSLKSLFKDEQRRIVAEIMATAREDLEHRFRLITERYTPLMKFLEDIHMPLPPALQTSADFVLQTDLHRVLQNGLVDLERLRRLTSDAAQRNLLHADFSYALKQKLEAMIDRLRATPGDFALLENLAGLAGEVVPLQIGLNLARTQNVYFIMLQQTFPGYRADAARGDGKAREWVRLFLALGRHLEFALDPADEVGLADERQAA